MWTHFWNLQCTNKIIYTVQMFITSDSCISFSGGHLGWIPLWEINKPRDWLIPFHSTVQANILRGTSVTCFLRQTGLNKKSKYIISSQYIYLPPYVNAHSYPSTSSYSSSPTIWMLCYLLPLTRRAQWSLVSVIRKGVCGREKNTGYKVRASWVCFYLIF